MRRYRTSPPSHFASVRSRTTCSEAPRRRPLVEGQSTPQKLERRRTIGGTPPRWRQTPTGPMRPRAPPRGPATRGRRTHDPHGTGANRPTTPSTVEVSQPAGIGPLKGSVIDPEKSRKLPKIRAINEVRFDRGDRNVTAWTYASEDVSLKLSPVRAHGSPTAPSTRHDRGSTGHPDIDQRARSDEPNPHEVRRPASRAVRDGPDRQDPGVDQLPGRHATGHAEAPQGPASNQATSRAPPRDPPRASSATRTPCKRTAPV